MGAARYRRWAAGVLGGVRESTAGQRQRNGAALPPEGEIVAASPAAQPDAAYDGNDNVKKSTDATGEVTNYSQKPPGFDPETMRRVRPVRGKVRHGTPAEPGR